MHINEIYYKYKIIPSIIKHQKLVAAVAWQICDELDISKNESEIIVKTCLLHDMGNILKRTSNKFLPKDGTDWEKYMLEFSNKYGENHDIATLSIIKELGIKDKEKILKKLEWIGASNILSKDFEEIENIEIINLIAPYADVRVAPDGIVSIDQRIKEAKARNSFIKDETNKIKKYYRKIEERIFSFSKIKPNNIDKTSINKYLKKVDRIEL